MTPSPPPSTLFERIGGRAVLAELVRHFYADVRQSREIGPIFNQVVHDWPAHLEKITDFWSGATGGPALYTGPMPLRHLPLGLQPNHFETWLDLFRRQCRIRLKPAEAEELIARAEAIGERLREIVRMAGPQIPRT